MTTNNTENLTKCPYCKETIKDNALKCRFCMSVLTPPEISQNKSSFTIQPKPLNPADNIAHRVALTVLSGLMVINSMDISEVPEDAMIDEISASLIIVLCIGIYNTVILMKSNENRIWLLVILAVLIALPSLYLEPIFGMRKENLSK